MVYLSKYQFSNWSAKSPDPNLIKNLWGILSRLVYQNGKQFDDMNSLIEECIRKCWDEEISLETLTLVINAEMS